MNNIECPYCNKGVFKPAKVDYIDDNNNVYIKNIDVEVCDHCGERIYPSETVRKIEKYYQIYN